MVKVKKGLPRHGNGDIDINSWIKNHLSDYNAEHQEFILKACLLAKTEIPSATFYGQPCFEQGLEMAELLIQLHLDPASIAAAIIYSTINETQLEEEDITLQVGRNVSSLVLDTAALSSIDLLHQQTKPTPKQIENLRKMLITMVQDVRAVLIKLAERVCIMRGIQLFGPDERRQYAQETFQIYAPLANRLGIYAIKWELEDLSFHDLHPATYKSLAKQLNEKRTDRVNRVENTIQALDQHLSKQNIEATITGRAKHIYSIHNKMEQKKLRFEDIFDTHAVRVIVPRVKDCYEVLGFIHQQWTPIPEEFDDYIATPKPNGYRSIHTAVIDEDGKNIEVQIRTHEMHEENELGVAAHWMYKEGRRHGGGVEDKITWLRQILEWHKEIDTEAPQTHDDIHHNAFEERVYIFTPQGDIIDLPKGATPIDAAYSIHSEVGNRCKGAKINGKLVPLTYCLHTGDSIEITTGREPNPSRDWLNPEFGYIKTSRARAKITHFFNQTHRGTNIQEGRQLFEKECQKNGIRNANLNAVARKMSFSTTDNFLIALACGHIRPTQILQALRETEDAPEETHTPTQIHTKAHKSHRHAPDVDIFGMTHLLSHLANCCKPLPGDAIIGYITLGRGVSIHRRDCANVEKLVEHSADRLIEVTWNDEEENSRYRTDLSVQTSDYEALAKQVPVILNHYKIPLLNLSLEGSERGTGSSVANLTIMVKNQEEMTSIMHQISQLKTVGTVKRGYNGN